MRDFLFLHCDVFDSLTPEGMLLKYMSEIARVFIQLCSVALPR